MSFGEVFRRILVIHEFVLRGASKINYFKVQGIGFQLGLLNSIDSRLPIFVFCNAHLGEQIRDMHKIFGKVLSPSDLLILGGPAGGSAPGKVLRPHDTTHMACRDGDSPFS